MIAKVIKVTIDGQPVAKGRPRIGRYGAYTPQKTADAEEWVGWVVKQSLPSGWEPDGEHEWQVWVHFHVRKNGRGDLDNFVKLILDALNGLVWKDDKQVKALSARRSYHARKPRTELELLKETL
jgi:Holliday junction resolvase RusA-like endonuclease